MGWFDQLQTFMPHGMCLLWQPELMILHIVSDGLIALAYFAIPFGIAQFVNGRTDLESKHRFLACLFAAFIGLCGVTHIASILVLWYPYYVTEGWLKAITAVASVATAMFALSLVPALLRLPSAKALQDEINSHRATLSQLELARTALLSRVDFTEYELKRVEESLFVSDSLLRTVIEAVPGAIYAKDQQGRMLLANRGALDAIGMSWNEIKGRTDNSFLQDEQLARTIMENDRLIMASGVSRNLEETIVGQDGTEKDFLATKTPLLNAEGDVIGIVGISIDITERKRLENEAARSINAALVEKTQALEQRDILLREVYHRVKNNLQLIDSFLVVQGRLLDDQSAKAALKRLRDRVYALGLVHHQLMASADLSTFSIKPFLDELIANLVDSASSSEIELVMRADPITVGLDFAIPFGLIVTELVTNAIKHAFPLGRGTIHITVQRTDLNRVLLTVKDNGVGESTPPSQVGSNRAGLGKSIVDSMVRQLQGSITSVYDRGTVVEVQVKGPDTP